MGHFNPLGRKTETYHHLPFLYVFIISIHSVARPRLSPLLKTGRIKKFQSTRSQDRDISAALVDPSHRHFNPLGRKTETPMQNHSSATTMISIHSVARPRLAVFFTKSPARIISIHSVARPRHTSFPQQSHPDAISIHSVARPRQIQFQKRSMVMAFQSTRSQDRDKPLWTLK